MSESENAPTEAPATWENVVVAKAKEVLGRAVQDDALVEEGEQQEHVAHEVREDYQHPER